MTGLSVHLGRNAQLGAVAKYTITFARSARKELQALDSSIVRRLVAQIESLADNSGEFAPVTGA